MDSAERSSVLSSFPTLRGTSWRITSPATSQYNCVGWAVQDEHRWWWPAPSYYWPENIPREASLDAFTTAFVALGYEVCADTGHEHGYLKVAIFANEYGPTHVVRELANGEWTSKLGSSVDIVHPLESLEGPVYGHIVQMLRRPTREE